jgi:hypothetical protein
MGNFQDSRFFGFSGRTLWVTVVIVAVVVGLFFIPETIKFALYSKKLPTVSRSLSESKKLPAKVETDRAAISPEALKAISSSVSTTPAPAKSLVAKKTTDGDDGDRPGLFSGWNFRVKASDAGGGGAQVPSGLSLEKIGTKEFQSLVKRSRSDVRRFISKYAPKNRQVEEISSTFLDQLDLASRDSAKGLSPNALLEGLLDLHISTIKALAHSGADRGVIIEWLKIPIVSFVDDKVGLDGMDKVKGYFAPRMVLNTAKVRQRRSNGWGADGRSPATLQAEVMVRGTDVDKVILFNNGKKISESSGARVGSDGMKAVRMRGDANGVWTIVAYDKFGARPYWKSYAFYPKVRRFRQEFNGEYLIGFSQNSAPNSLDRFFMVGSSKLRQHSSDPAISMF